MVGSFGSSWAERLRCSHRLVLWLLGAAALSACAGPLQYLPRPPLQPTVRGYEDQLNQYVGLSSVELAKLLGAPNSAFPLRSGSEIWTYTRHIATRQFGQSSSVTLGNQFGSTSSGNSSSIGYNINCSTSFEVNKTGTVVDWKHDGLGCLAPQEPHGNDCVEVGSVVRIASIRSLSGEGGVLVTGHTGERWAVPDRKLKMVEDWRNQHLRLAACNRSPNGAYLLSVDSMKLVHARYLGWP